MSGRRWSTDKAAVLQHGTEQVPVDVVNARGAIRDPFVLEFLDLKDEYSENDLEDALIGKLADFLLELGDDFTLLARQRRMRIDDSWFRVDLTLYHRTLRCLVLVVLKLGRYSLSGCWSDGLVLELRAPQLGQTGREPTGGPDPVCGEGCR